MTEDEAATNLYQLLNWRIFADVDKLRQSRSKLAHYTAADTALKIIESRSLWLRNAAVMNDFSEIGFGKMELVNALKGSAARINDLVGRHHVGLVAEVFAALSAVEGLLNAHTYLTSFAAHEEDDRHGRLSMWRAYGGNVAGVAMLFNTDVLESESDELSVFIHRVNYGPAEFLKGFQGFLERLSEADELLAAVPRGRVERVLFHTLQDFILTTKHPAFREEEEWRLIHSPAQIPSRFLQPKIVPVEGMPQVVFPMPLRNEEGLGMPELELDRMLHGIIVGPCAYPNQVVFALMRALTAAGVAEAHNRVWFSEIPLRR